MEENQIKPEKNRLPPTDRLPLKGPGRPKGSKGDPIKKARKQLVEEYKDALAEALPMISPVLIKKAFSGEGDLGAIREINDILVDKAPKNVKMEGELKITPILNGLSTNDSSK